MFIRGLQEVFSFRRKSGPCKRLHTGGGEKYTTARVQGSELITDPGG